MLQTVDMEICNFKPEYLLKRRKDEGLTRAQLADLAGISPDAISKYERGEREPNNDALRKLGKAFDVYFIADWSGCFEPKL